MYEEILPKEELTRLKRSFALFDVDGDGTISTKVIYPTTQFDGCIIISLSWYKYR